MKAFSLLAILISILLPVATGASGFDLVLPKFIDSEAPVEIVSDSLVWETQKGHIVFKGSVKLKQDDFELEADRLEAISGEGKDIEQIEAEGHVRMKRATWSAICGKAVFHAKDSTLVLTSEPEITKEGQRLKGKKITLHLDTEKMEIERARAVLNMGSE